MHDPNNPRGLNLSEDAAMALQCATSETLPEHWLDSYWIEAARLNARLIHLYHEVLTDGDLGAMISIGGLLVRHAALAEQAGDTAGRLLARIGGKP